jgi:hypothetical protein
MFDNTVIIAEFNSPDEAHLALSRLQEASIRGFVTGDQPNPTTFSLLGRMQYDAVRLHVAESDAERAAEILANVRDAELSENWEDEAEMAVEGWICPVCDTEVAKELTTCPDCGAGRCDESADEEP